MLLLPRLLLFFALEPLRLDPPKELLEEEGLLRVGLFWRELGFLAGLWLGFLEPPGRLLPPGFLEPPGRLLPPGFLEPPGRLLPPGFLEPPGRLLPPGFLEPPGLLLPPGLVPPLAGRALVRLLFQPGDFGLRTPPLPRGAAPPRVAGRFPLKFRAPAPALWLTRLMLPPLLKL